MNAPQCYVICTLLVSLCIHCICRTTTVAYLSTQRVCITPIESSGFHFLGWRSCMQLSKSEVDSDFRIPSFWCILCIKCNPSKGSAADPRLRALAIYFISEEHWYRALTHSAVREYTNMLSHRRAYITRTHTNSVTGIASTFNQQYETSGSEHRGYWAWSLQCNYSRYTCCKTIVQFATVKSAFLQDYYVCNKPSDIIFQSFPIWRRVLPKPTCIR